MDLGAFSVSLAVKSLQASKAFYQTLGFAVFAGDEQHNYLIMKNGEHLIGLFQGMFEQNILTFNPGWNQNAERLPEFTEVREIQRQVRAAGIEVQQAADENSSGPASFVVVDPDGNTILFDQHV